MAMANMSLVAPAGDPTRLAFALIKAGMSEAQVSQRLGLPLAEIKTLLANYKGRGRPAGSSALLKAIATGEDQKVVAFYQRGVGLPAVAAHFNLPVMAVRKILTAHNIVRRRGPKRLSETARVLRVEIIELFKRLNSVEEVAQQLHCSLRVVRTVLRKTKLPMGPEALHERLADRTAWEIAGYTRCLRDEGYFLSEMAVRMGMRPQSVQNILTRFGIELTHERRDLTFQSLLGVLMDSECASSQFAAVLRATRKKEGTTRSEFAHSLGVLPSQLGAWEKEVTLPDNPIRVKILAKLKRMPCISVALKRHCEIKEKI